ncbi:MAG TPA: flagellar basal-body rod protein FlgF [Rhodocyclaceae bacterium]|nr:flagellar basal-body rod protein FlgF [Rhodocyclaceae bacterium]
MDRLLYTAMTGASGTMNRQAAVAHNLANVSTTGYRAEEHRLRAVQVQTHNQPPALPTRAFVVDASTHTNYDVGPVMQTNRPLDVVVQGSGWIAVTAPDGTEAYTRDGNLQLSVNGVLQTRNGLNVVGDGGPIAVPPDQQVEIGRDGTVSIVPITGLRTSSPVGRIKLVNPAEADLERRPDGMFRLKTGQPAPINDNVRLSTGVLEGSNVNASEQMISMISLARQFEMQVKMMTNAETNDRAATQLLSVN